jgi:hypothetical protein
VDAMQDGLGVGLDLGEVLGDLVAAGVLPLTSCPTFGF